jgi:hypothetical protein
MGSDATSLSEVTHLDGEIDFIVLERSNNGWRLGNETKSQMRGWHDQVRRISSSCF